MKNVVLIGFMGTGKTIAGKEVADRLRFEYVDVDELIEKSEDMKITDIFKKYGEAYFREREKESIVKLRDRENLVLAAGGGVVLFQENIDNLKHRGVMICLRATADVIYNRLKDLKDRPLLNVDNPKEKINTLLKFREPFYKKADYSVDTSNLSIEEVVERICEVYTKATKD